MRTVTIQKTQFRVSDFLGWQRDGSLELSPYFQRRPVWKPEAKSFFLDTVVRGLPAPVIYLREKIELDSQTTIREIVDGQQRLRTLIAFIDPDVLPDFDKKRDVFTIKPVHNAELAGKTYGELPKSAKVALLSYEFSTHVLPTTMEDRDILQMFARLNATGVKLNHQELRNAEYFGEFKTLMYELALEQLDRWRDWAVVSDDQIARMREVELTSDIALSMISGLTGKTQARIDDLYVKYDETFPGKEVLADRFRRVMDTIDDLLGQEILDTVFRSEVYFYTLFVFLYDKLWGLGSALNKKKAERLPASTRDCLLMASKRFATEQVPASVLDAVRRASSDIGRRRIRLQYLKSVCDGKTAK